jgi:hypothetical protein
LVWQRRYSPPRRARDSAATLCPRRSLPRRSRRPQAGQWTVDAREHVDLWLHAFALVQADSSRVPFFRRGYHDSVIAQRSGRT